MGTRFGDALCGSARTVNFSGIIVLKSIITEPKRAIASTPGQVNID